MKAGRLFEKALKQAQITLKPGTEMKIQVQGKGAKLQLVVSASNAFENIILERSRKVSIDALKPYNPKVPVGERIRVIRQATGLTLDTVASKAEITKGSLCSIEKGERSVGLTVLKKISKALGISITALVE